MDEDPELSNSKPTAQPTIPFDTVEVRRASLLVPTISINNLPYRASFRGAPNGSIKDAEIGSKFRFLRYHSY